MPFKLSDRANDFPLLSLARYCGVVADESSGSSSTPGLILKIVQSGVRAKRSSDVLAALIAAVIEVNPQTFSRLLQTKKLAAGLPGVETVYTLGRPGQTLVV